MEQMTRVQQNTLRKIVEAAIELMSEKGFHRVSVQEVGKKAGICEKTVFRYFATKKSLLDEIIRYREYASELKKEFENRKTWDLAHDLKLAGAPVLPGDEGQKERLPGLLERAGLRGYERR